MYNKSTQCFRAVRGFLPLFLIQTLWPQGLFKHLTNKPIVLV